MGLSHNIDLDTGTSAKHFRIANMQLYPETGIADITVDGYINHGAYQSGKKPVYSGAFRMPMLTDLTQVM